MNLKFMQFLFLRPKGDDKKKSKNSDKLQDFPPANLKKTDINKHAEIEFLTFAVALIS